MKFNKIQNDQVEVFPLMQIWFSIQKSIDTIHHINKLKKKKSMITSISIEKAFNKIHH